MAEAAAQARDVQLSTRTLIKVVQLRVAAAERFSLEHYAHAGAGLRELKGRPEAKHWRAFLKKHFDVSEATARRWMKAADHADSLKDTRAAATLSEAAGDHRPHHYPKWADEETARRSREQWEQRTKATAHYRSQRDTRIAEGRLLRERATQLIDAGYRILAAKYHPDKEGGSHAEMTRTTKARDKLRAAAKFF